MKAGSARHLVLEEEVYLGFLYTVVLPFKSVISMRMLWN